MSSIQEIASQCGQGLSSVFNGVKDAVVTGANWGYRTATQVAKTGAEYASKAYEKSKSVFNESVVPFYEKSFKPFVQDTANKASDFYTKNKGTVHVVAATAGAIALAAVIWNKCFAKPDVKVEVKAPEGASAAVVGAAAGAAAATAAAAPAKA